MGSGNLDWTGFVELVLALGILVVLVGVFGRAATMRRQTAETDSAGRPPGHPGDDGGRRRE